MFCTLRRLHRIRLTSELYRRILKEMEFVPQSCQEYFLHCRHILLDQVSSYNFLLLVQGCLCGFKSTDYFFETLLSCNCEFSGWQLEEVHIDGFEFSRFQKS